MHRQGAIPELLIPASSPEVLKVAVRYGADAVYIGGEAFSLRAKAKNFSIDEMREGIEYAHAHGVKVYVTVNILAHNEDLAEADEYLGLLEEMKPDALLVSDPGLFVRARRVCPSIPIHISTQANNVNYETFLFWHGLGAERVVCGRELSLKEIGEIRRHIPDELEIEAFIHGAMCISYSGRCLLSNYLTQRDSNQGDCAQPCRWKYHLVEETRPDTYLPIEENDAAANYLKTIISGIGIEDAKITLAKEENDNEYIYTVDCGREDGALIGRRGETLDAIQYLLRLSINKGLSDDKHRKVSVNVGNYREKRNENLRQLAAKNARTVLKYGRNVALEPMNPYERRIIHTEIQKIEGVTSFSTGVDSGRRVIIALEEGVTPTNPSKGGYNKRDNYRGGNRGGDRRGNDRRGGGGGYRKKEAYQPAVTREPRKDSAGSLYGKIEIPQAGGTPEQAPEQE